MATTTATPIRASTQEHLDVEDVQDDIAILKDGSCSIILQVTAINFDLLSEGEQDAIIYAYAGLLNSLTFSVQIIIRSSVKDVTDYLQHIKGQEQKQGNHLLLDQLKKYRQFIESTIQDNQVLDKRFYIIIPFSSLELGIVTPLVPTMQKKRGLPYPKTYILERAKMSLFPKRDHLFRQLGRLGLQAKQLNTQQVIELLYSNYNQESVGQKLSLTRDYGAPMVEASNRQPKTDISKQKKVLAASPAKPEGHVREFTAPHQPPPSTPATTATSPLHAPEAVRRVSANVYESGGAPTNQPDETNPSQAATNEDASVDGAFGYDSVE